MQRERQNKQNKPGKERKEGYIVVPNYFLREWVKVLEVGPAMLYLYLLTYCHKGKDIAWPTISTLSKEMNLTPKTITKYRQTLVKYGLIKKVSKRKTASGCHMQNIYQLTPFDMGKNTLPIGNIYSYLEGKFTPDIGKNLPTNNTNLNITNITTTKRKKDAAVAVNFKKLKEKGEEKMRAPYSSKEKEHYTGQAPYNSKEKEHYTGQAIRERMVKLDFKEEFIEKILKEYSLKKIEEKLDLLMEKRNIQNPPAWLNAALKNDYRGEEQERYDEESVRQEPQTLRMDSRVRGNDRGRRGNDKKILSTEEVRRRFHSLKEKLLALN